MGIRTFFTEAWRAAPFRTVPALITTAVLVVLLCLPTPEGLSDQGWQMLAIFLTTIVAIISKVMPIGVMALMSLVIVAFSKVTSNTSKGAVTDVLASMANPLIWLIVVAILISLGLKNTGLGRRLGMLFIAALGKRTIGIGYGLALCELLLAPVTPSNTARGGGIMHPIMKSIAVGFDSDPAKGTERKVGTYLALVNYHANPITSAMFLTATAPNPLVQSFVSKATGGAITLTWTSWALAMLMPGVVALLLMPLVIYLLAPPELKHTPDAVTMAKHELKTMGPLSTPEIVMLGTFILLLVLWANLPAMVFGPAFTLDPTAVALLGLFILVISGTVQWSQVLAEKSAWDTLIWFGALVMMAEQLNKLGVISWFSKLMENGIVSSGLPWEAAALVLVLVFALSHYAFASTTAHISAMMLAFLTVGLALVPAPYQGLFVLMMVAASAIMMTLTHYATGTSPIIFGSGYVTMGHWWGVGLVMCVVELLVFAVVGGLWWKALGYW
ncbi:DASS family sodium-coupled anion symporter [Lampropedia puyangensis]|uniref:DASS family sodium-coupled anion symporter n=1 Tax=Lampropedia puyangensis TaxID=1330072 RepID=A0A4S8EX37_9BURK|nr:DASS family sodium-coupled anion symporter [Lampropedia puyangensis]THT99372.1 DASS family sodium-coupled anion symporter [Lampropedia puyangensis]